MPVSRVHLHLPAAVALAFALGAPAAVSAQAPTIASLGQPIDGIRCEGMEGQGLHIHQHLTILDRGHPVNIPADVGQVPAHQCLYWLHTHTLDGIIHIEAPLNRSFTLGDFFTIWGQPLDRTEAASARASKGQRLKVWVNGTPYTGDPRAIKLASHTDIVIEAGPPFPKVAPFTKWGPL